jgi:hypothetical protein
MATFCYKATPQPSIVAFRVEPVRKLTETDVYAYTPYLRVLFLKISFIKEARGQTEWFRFVGQCVFLEASMRNYLIAGLAFMAAGPAFAQNQYTRQVNNQLDTMESNARGQGKSRLFRSPIFRLNEGQTQVYPVTFVRGRSYTIGGVCDNDCPDLDIKLIDPNGREVASDVLTDSAPVVSHNASMNGTYRVRVVMYDCNVNPCSAGLTVMGSGGGGGNSVPAAGQYDQQVNNQLDTFERGQSGATRLFRSPIFRLNEGASQDYRVTMIAGVPYKIAGVCDNDCPDLDIKLIDGSGNVLASDSLTDSLPIVSYQPSRSGDYNVRVIMYDCNVAPCSAGLTVMATGPASAVNSTGTGRSQYDQQVNNQLDAMERNATGKTRLFRSPIFRLNEGATQDYPVTINAGQSYTIGGVCDNDCPDLDIKLLDASGTEVASDTATDSVPLVSYSANKTGMFTVRVVMYDCNVAPCSAGLTVMASGQVGMPNIQNAVPSSGTTQYDQQVNNQLDAAERNAAGMSRLFRSPIFRLTEGATQDYPIAMRRGQRYTIAGVCDNDCPDLDIKLIDPNGSQVVQDTATDSVPVVTHSPGSDGTYTVRVVMYDCNVAPCSAGLTIMGTGGAAASGGTALVNKAPTTIVNRPATAVGQYDAQVNAQLDSFERGQSSAVRLFRSPIFRLNEGADRDFVVSLIAGVNYKIAGVCDNDCPDLDIKLIDQDGNTLANDALTDSLPIVTYRPTRGGPYKVRVVMYDCNSAPCSAGVTVMATN